MDTVCAGANEIRIWNGCVRATVQMGVCGWDAHNVIYAGAQKMVCEEYAVCVHRKAFGLARLAEGKITFVCAYGETIYSKREQLFCDFIWSMHICQTRVERMCGGETSLHTTQSESAHKHKSREWMERNRILRGLYLNNLNFTCNYV